MDVKTKHFNPKTDPKLLCTCGHIDCDKRSVKLGILTMLERVRIRADRPLTVTSGGRCPNHIDEAGRAKPADHQKRQAVDISVSGGYERAELVSLGIEAGFNAIGVAKTFVHLGYRPDKKLVMWTY